MKAVILFMLVFSMNAFSQVKVGILNVQKVINSIKEGKSVMTTLEKSFNAKKSVLSGDEAKIKKAQEDLKKQSMVLSDQARNQKESQIQQMIMEIQKKQAGFQKEIQQQEGDLKKPILEKLSKVVEEVCKADNIDITFEISVAPVYVKEKIDLTDKVIAAYDKKHK